MTICNNHSSRAIIFAIPHPTSASIDKTVRLWRTADGSCIRTFSEHSECVRHVAFSPDGTLLASGGNDCTVGIWDVQTRSAIGEPLRGHTVDVTSISFSPDGQFIYSCSRDATIRCWDAHTGSPLGIPLIGHTKGINSLAVSRDGYRIASGSKDRTLRIWNAQAFHWDKDQSWLSCGLQGPHQIPKHIPDDGWIRSSEGKLHLWVPVAHQRAVCRIDELCISKNEDHPCSPRIIWGRLCHGESWVKIHV